VLKRITPSSVLLAIPIGGVPETATDFDNEIHLSELEVHSHHPSARAVDDLTGGSRQTSVAKEPEKSTFEKRFSSAVEENFPEQLDSWSSGSEFGHTLGQSGDGHQPEANG
jgi:hypothetical protein